MSKVKKLSKQIDGLEKVAGVLKFFCAVCLFACFLFTYIFAAMFEGRPSGILNITIDDQRDPAVTFTGEIEVIEAFRLKIGDPGKYIDETIYPFYTEEGVKLFHMVETDDNRGKLNAGEEVVLIFLREEY